jgi:tetratricopeptide (TPR) repeat protein
VKETVNTKEMTVGAESPPFSPRKPQVTPCYQQNNMSPASAEAKPIGFLKAQEKTDPFHVMYKVPVGDTPYGRAKHLQLVEKDPTGAIASFWEAINAGDRIDSALKDMAVVMNQQNRPLEAIEAIKSFRHLCSKQAQEPLDNVLLDLLKKCGRFDEQISLLKHKLRLIQEGAAFNGKSTKTARSHGRKFQVSIKKETTRLLGNLGWAFMQQHDYCYAEIVYRKAQVLEPDDNKVCNLSVCLMRQGKVEEAMDLLQGLLNNNKNSMNYKHNNSRGKSNSLDRVEALLKEIGDSKTEGRTGEECQSAASRVEDLEWVWCCEDGGGGSQEEEKGWGAAVEVNRKGNRLRVFQEMTSAL